MKGIKRLVFSAVAAVSSILICVSPVYGAMAIDNAVSAHEEAESEMSEADKQLMNRNGNIETDDFSIKVVCGLQGNYRVGAPVPVTADILSRNSDFSGVLRVVIPGSTSYGSEAVAYEKEILLVAGEEKTINLTIQNDNSSAILNFQLENEKGKVVVDETFKFGSQANQNALVGILSDDYTALNYFDQVHVGTNNYDGTAQLIELKTDDIPTSSGSLECLSYLIINSYDTSRLSEAQLQAIKDWVNLGGVLILGGGSDYKLTNGGFADWVPFGEYTGTSTSFRVIDNAGNVMEPDIVFSDEGTLFIADIEGAEYLDGVINDIDFVKDYKYESGHVIALGFNLGMEPVVSAENSSTLASVLLSKAANGYSAQRLNSINYGTYSDIWTISSNLSNLMEHNYPNLYVIMGILLLFAILGPVLYFILKKKDKREWLWIIVPALSIVFTVIIFVVNSDIRIKNPIVTSMTTIIEAEENGVPSCSASVNMSILTPGTELTSVLLSKDLHNLNNMSGNADFLGTINSTNITNSYTTAMRQTAEGYVVNLRNSNTFESKYFSADYTKEIVSGNQGLKSEMKKTITGLSGSIINDTGMDMMGGCIFTYGAAIPFGEIKNGEKFTFEEADNYSSYDGDIYSLKYPGITENSKEFNLIRTTCQNSYYSYMSTDINSSQNAVYVVGVVKDWDCNYVDDPVIAEYGSASYIKRFNVEYADYKNASVERLFSYGLNYDNLDLNDGQLYKVPAEEDFYTGADPNSVLALMRAADNSARYGNTANTTIYAFNWATEGYDLLFANGLVEEFKNGCPYVDETGVVRLRFEANNAYEDYAPAITIVIGGTEDVGN